MIGKLVELVGALCSRSTWRSFSKAEIRQELLAIVRAAAETLLAIESTERAQAALDGPGAPRQCASSAGCARGNGRSGARHCVCLAFVCRSVRTLKAVGAGCSSEMCVL
jgi:hypothetical protein